MYEYDVVIPLKSTNKLVVDNIIRVSDFHEVRKILIGDAGVESKVLTELSKIPKVKILQQRGFFSQGACIIDLVKNVETEYFVYLHADVVLPVDWFNVMREKLGNSMFAESGRKFDYSINHQASEMNRQYPLSRPNSGSQMGKTDFFLSVTKGVDDDFLFRNEDLVFADLVDQFGGNYKIINDTYHYHQIGYTRKNENISNNVELSFSTLPTKDDIWLFECQAEGIIKYTKPRPNLLHHLMLALSVLEKYGKKKDFTRKVLKKEEYKLWHLHIRMYPIYFVKFRMKKIVKLILSDKYTLIRS